MATDASASTGAASEDYQNSDIVPGQEEQCALPAKVKPACSPTPAAKVWKVTFAKPLFEVLTHDICDDPQWLQHDLLYEYPYPNISDKEVDRENVPALSWESRDFNKPRGDPETVLKSEAIAIRRASSLAQVVIQEDEEWIRDTPELQSAHNDHIRISEPRDGHVVAWLDGEALEFRHDKRLLADEECV